MVSLSTVLAVAVAMAVYCVAVPVTSTENAVKDIKQDALVGSMPEARGDVTMPVAPNKLELSSRNSLDQLTTADMEGNFNGVAGSDSVMKEPQLIDQPKERAPPSPPQATKPQNNEAPAPAAPKEKDNMPNIVVAIPSMRRWQKDKTPAPEKYLYNLVTGIWNQMTDKEKMHVSFLLMNVDKQPEMHEELLQLSSHPAVKVITKRSAGVYSTPSVGTNGMAKLEDGREVSKEAFEWVAGETRDAPMLILEASKMAPYVLFLEDDVTPTSHVMTKIFQTVHEMKNEGKDFFMLDLYTPAIYWGPKSATNKERYEFECCTQAMLFDSKKVPSLVEYEMTHPGEPVDDNIRDFVRQRPEFGIFAMVPNPFEHVGRFSSNPEKSTGVTEHRSLSFVP